MVRVADFLRLAFEMALIGSPTKVASSPSAESVAGKRTLAETEAILVASWWVARNMSAEKPRTEMRSLPWTIAAMPFAWKAPVLLKKWSRLCRFGLRGPPMPTSTAADSLVVASVLEMMMVENGGETVLQREPIRHCSGSGAPAYRCSLLYDLVPTMGV
jgi:hypothetical protein